MTLEELRAALLVLKESDGDTEEVHYEADMLLLKFIGDPEVRKLFLSLDRWYA